MKQTLRAVAFMHTQRFVHKDLKPQNIMMVDDSSSSIKVCRLCELHEGILVRACALCECVSETLLSRALKKHQITHPKLGPNQFQSHERYSDVFGPSLWRLHGECNVCCEVIIWAKFGLCRGYFLGQVDFGLFYSGFKRFCAHSVTILCFCCPVSRQSSKKAFLKDCVHFFSNILVLV